MKQSFTPVEVTDPFEHVRQMRHDLNKLRDAVELHADLVKRHPVYKQMDVYSLFRHMKEYDQSSAGKARNAFIVDAINEALPGIMKVVEARMLLKQCELTTQYNTLEAEFTACFVPQGLK